MSENIFGNEGRGSNKKMGWISVLTVSTIIVAWFSVTEFSGSANKLKIPYPSSVWITVLQLNVGIFSQVGVTLYRILSGFIIGSLTGILVGIAMTSSRIVEAIVDPIVEALRPCPPLAFIPFFILWMGIGDLPKIVLVALGAFLTLVVVTVEAIKNVPRVYIHAAQTLGADSKQLYTTIIINSIVPNIVGGIRVAFGMSFALGIAAEFMGAQRGIGYIIMVAQRTLQTPAILYGMLWLAITSYIADRVLRSVTRHILRWTE